MKATPYCERVDWVACEDSALLAITTLPSQSTGPTGVVIVVGGPQYRVGSHRQFVQLARHLASHGVAAIRFDVRGMGDSPGALRDFESITPDIRAAIGHLMSVTTGLQKVVIWGLCDGASASLLYLGDKPDPRVGGLVLMNPWVRTAASQAKTQVKHYYASRLRSREFWVKLVTGQIAGKAVTEAMRAARRALRAGQPGRVEGQLPYTERMAMIWDQGAHPILLLMSQHDLTAREFDEFTAMHPAWRRAMASCPPTRIDLLDADHTCSSPQARHAVEDATLQWVRSR